MSSRFFWNRRIGIGKIEDAEAYLEEFQKQRFDTLKLPELLGSETELRELQELISTKDSDFWCVWVNCLRKTPTDRAARVTTTEDIIYSLLNEKHREFVGFVLRNYMDVGVDELDISILSILLAAKYESLSTANEELGKVAGVQ